MTKVILASRNKRKTDELRALLAGVEVGSLLDFPEAGEIEETGTTFAANAEIKARAVAEATGCIALADDSGLEVDALGGRPGVYSSRFAGPDATDEQKNRLILEMLEGVPDESRTARFRAAVAIATPDGRAVTVEGAVEGRIAHEPRGENGFGYDPIFYVPDLGKTTAEMSPDEKNSISHRGKAMRAAVDALADLLNDRGVNAECGMRSAE